MVASCLPRRGPAAFCKPAGAGGAALTLEDAKFGPLLERLAGDRRTLHAGWIQ
jgi:hypothetical protein